MQLSQRTSQKIYDVEGIENRAVLLMVPKAQQKTPRLIPVKYHLRKFRIRGVLLAPLSIYKKNM
jgi:hypothetical protein